MMRVCSRYVKKTVESLPCRDRIIDYNTILMNTIVSAEVAINQLTKLKETVKTNAATLSVNKMLILGAEFEMISDYIKAIMQEHDL